MCAFVTINKLLEFQAFGCVTTCKFGQPRKENIKFNHNEIEKDEEINFIEKLAQFSLSIKQVFFSMVYLINTIIKHKVMHFPIDCMFRSAWYNLTKFHCNDTKSKYYKCNIIHA